MRILAVDPGEKRIGLAISDPTGTIANPLYVIKHVSRKTDAARILDICKEKNVKRIIIGQSLDEENQPTYQGRKAARLAAVLKTMTTIPVFLWDEYESTKTARQARIAMNSRRKKRAGHLDELAATVILQSYLDTLAHPRNTAP